MEDKSHLIQNRGGKNVRGGEGVEFVMRCINNNKISAYLRIIIQISIEILVIL